MSEADKIIKSLRDSGKKVEEFYMSNKTSDKNVGSIEEDIEILERFKNNEMQRDKLERDNRCGGWKIGDIYKHLELNTAIEHLLLDYTRQKQINEEHQKINGELRQAINTVEKEKADWIKAYQEEKDSQFELLKRIQELETKNKYLESLSECQHSYLENSIPTQVVIDKINENSNIIKEIEEKIKEEENSGDICREYIRDLKRQKGLVKRDILTLQKLLEGEK